MKQAVFIKKKEILLNLRERSFRNGESEFTMVKQNPKIHREKQKEKWEKQAREKETLTFTILSARARAFSRLFSFWPCDEDSCFSTCCEICYKFPFVVQCKMWFKQNMQIEIPDEISGESP